MCAQRLLGETLADAFELDRSVAAGAGDLDRVDGELKQHLPGERIVAWVHRRQPIGDVGRVVATVLPLNAMQIAVAWASLVGHDLEAIIRRYARDAHRGAIPRRNAVVLDPWRLAATFETET